MTLLIAALAGTWSWARPYVLGLGVGLAVLFGAWRKGVTDERAKTKIEDVTNANRIRKDGADARASVDTSPDGLRKNDGWKRD